tara:strand:- start:246 stop:890 length:645 start_codon:yes stop_codon:yes gene_type:complete
MDEDIQIINENTRNEKIRNFFIYNKKKLIGTFLIILIFLGIFFFYKDYEEKQKIIISDQYNLLVTNFSEKNIENTKKSLLKIIKKNDPTYSPLSLYFIVDKDLISDTTQVNELFDNVILETPLAKETKNLIIFKKALYNAEFIEENELLEMLKPLINSNSVWKSHALYLVAEYFYSKNEKQKSKEFFEKIVSTENANQDLRVEAQKRINRDLSD